MDGSPKCLTFIKGRTIFEWQYRWLNSRKKFLDDPLNICVAIGGNKVLEDYFKNSFRESLFSGSSFSSIKTFGEVEPLGDAGAIRYYLENYVVEGNFLVLNGDTLSFYNLEDFVSFSDSNYFEYGTIVIKPFVVHLGLLQTEVGKIKSFREKPLLEEYSISCGTYMLHSRILDALPKKGDLAKDVIAENIDKFFTYSIKSDEWCAVESKKDTDFAENLIYRHLFKTFKD
jgi:NDP-sugar pyrophosphorylase family protein